MPVRTIFFFFDKRLSAFEELRVLRTEKARLEKEIEFMSNDLKSASESLAKEKEINGKNQRVRHFQFLLKRIAYRSWQMIKLQFKI